MFEARSDEYKNWLSELKVGDKVAIHNGNSWGIGRYSIYTITKITPTRRFKTSDHSEWNSDGTNRGGSSLDRIQPVTEEIAAYVKKRNTTMRIRKKLDSLDLEKLSIEQLNEIEELLDLL